jgi:hypothetical protein
MEKESPPLSELERKPSLFGQFYAFVAKKARSSELEINSATEECEYLIHITIRRRAGFKTKQTIQIEFNCVNATGENNPLLSIKPDALYLDPLVLGPAFFFANSLYRRVSHNSLFREDKNAFETELIEVIDIINKSDREQLMNAVLGKVLQQVVVKESRTNYVSKKLRIDINKYLNFLTLKLADSASLHTNQRMDISRLLAMTVFRGPGLVKLDLSLTNVNDLTVVSMLKKCPKLEILILRRTQIDGTCLLAVTDEKSNLKKVDLHLCREISAFNVVKFLANYSKLVYFYSDCLKWSMMSIPLERQNFERLTHLQLELGEEPWKGQEKWPILFARLTYLTELNFSNSSLSDRDCFNQIVALALYNCAALIVLNLNFCQAVSDGAFCTLPVNAKLVELHVAGTGVTIVSFYKLKDYLGQTLRTLNISNCMLMRDYDMGRIVVAFFENITRFEISFINSTQVPETLIRELENDLSYQNRYFNMFGFVKENTMYAVLELFIRKEKAKGKI